MKPLSRRHLLRGAGGIAIGLPFLEAMWPARMAQAAPFPKRLLIWFTGSGTILDKWRPTGTETAFTMGPITAALEPHKKNLVILDGLQIRGANGEGHTEGMGSQLTGMPLKPATGGTGFGTGTSIDQVIAQKVGTQTKIKSIEASVDKKTGSTWSRMNYLNDQPLPPEADPIRIFDRVFTGFVADPAKATQVAALREQRKTVLDHVAADYGALSKRLGGNDRQRLEAHLTTIREIEAKLSMTAPAQVGATCKPVRPGVPPATDQRVPFLGKAMMDLMATAFACDVTRVGSLMWEWAGQNMRYPWIGVADEHHQAHHDGKFAAVEKILTWLSGQFAYLLGKMKEYPEGNGTLLDNSLVFWTSEQANGNNHSKLNMPYMIAGGAGGAIRQGRYLRYSGLPNHSNLLVSILNAMDVPVKTFGNPSWCTGPLPNVVTV